MKSTPIRRTGDLKPSSITAKASKQRPLVTFMNQIKQVCTFLEDSRNIAILNVSSCSFPNFKKEVLFFKFLLSKGLPYQHPAEV